MRSGDVKKEYLPKMRERYWKASRKAERSSIIDEVAAVLGYQRKYAIEVLRKTNLKTSDKRNRKPVSRYASAQPIILLVGEVLDYPCAERLHPGLVETAELLERHGEVHLEPHLRVLLEAISRPCHHPGRRTRLQKEIPIEKYDSGEMRPGALEADLVEHNGGSSLDHLAYTLTVVDAGVLSWEGGN
jgi:hypothetical protein